MGWTHCVTVDHSEAHKPAVMCDLEFPPYPFEDDSADEIHAYDVLEHLGQQGDWRAFLAQFADCWRILKPGGFLAAICPSYTSPNAWGDPSHRRVLTPQSLSFLSQAEYAKQVGVTAMTDFRPWYAADYEPFFVEQGADAFVFVLEAIKPARRAA
jgi:SAM-dependent methyltransferase